MRPIPLLLLVLLLAACPVVSGCGGSAPSPGPGAAPEPPPLAVPAATRTRLVEILHGWDARRADAWRRGDVRRLRELYAPGSASGAADAAMLAAYVDRGLRVRGIRMQLLAVDVLARSPERIALAVTDRLVGAVAVGRGRPLTLPRDRPSTRTVVLRRDAGEWRVVEVRTQARPAATTAAPSRSRNS